MTFDHIDHTDHMISSDMIYYVSFIILFRYGSVDTTNHNTILALPKKPLSSTRDSELFISKMTNLPCTVNLDERNYQPGNIDSVRIT